MSVCIIDKHCSYRSYPANPCTAYRWPLQQRTREIPEHQTLLLPFCPLFLSSSWTCLMQIHHHSRLPLLIDWCPCKNNWTDFLQVQQATQGLSYITFPLNKYKNYPQWLMSFNEATYSMYILILWYATIQSTGSSMSPRTFNTKPLLNNSASDSVSFSQILLYKICILPSK